MGPMTDTPQVTVFGGAGYLGGHAGRALKAGGFRTILASRAPKAGPGPAWADAHGTVAWADAESIRAAVIGSHVVIHAAGPDAAACARNPDESVRESELAARSIADAAVAACVDRLIIFSTVHAWVDAPSAYGKTALARERAALAACSGSRTQLVIVRIANCFGAPVARAPGCWKLAVNCMGLEAVRSREIRLNSDGSASRDFVPATRFGACIHAIATMPRKQLPGGVVDACTGKRRTVMEMAQLIKARCQSVLGFAPRIMVGDAVEAVPPPESSPAALAGLGIVLPDDLIPEVDDLLRWCAIADHALHSQGVAE
jgi:nucleoside-diphosphate-sugar epimerase